MSEVEQRLGRVEEGLGKVETRLGAVEDGLEEVRDQVHALDGKVNALDGKVTALDGKVTALDENVQKLRLLEENNATEIKKVAEVQSHHGKKLDKITKALEPLARIDAFVNAVAHDHENRIRVLETRAGVRE